MLSFFPHLSPPKWISNWFFREPVSRPWIDPDARGQLPDNFIDFLGRPPLTRPSSPTPASGSIVNSKSLDVLPLEIRQQIWEEVLGGHILHLFIAPKLLGTQVRAERRLRSFECVSRDPATCNGDFRGHIFSDREKSSGEKPLLTLLLTCRQIYSEAIDFLYSSNHFMINDADVMEFLPLLLLPQRINAIRSLRFAWRFLVYPPVAGQLLNLQEFYWETQDIRRASWITTWHNISNMQNLQDLHVELEVYDEWWIFDPEIAKVLLEPIMKVTIPYVFVLSLPRPQHVASIFRSNSVYSWAAHEDWTCIDPWDKLPCTIRIVES